MPTRPDIHGKMPPPLMTSDPGSFARATIVKRKPQIIDQVIEDNAYPPAVLRALAEFKEEIASQPIRPIQEKATDVNFWNDQQALYQGCTWLEVPWYFAETYFYRRLLEATTYFQPGPLQRLDPFLKQKIASIQAGVEWFDVAWLHFEVIEPQVAFEALLHSCLWGNRADLSNYTVEEQARGGLAALEERHLILIDHTDQVRQLLRGGLPRVDFITDNVGKELLFDLALADYILRQGWAGQVVFRLKDRPFFVSDAMPADVQATLAQIGQARSLPTRQLGQRLSYFHASDKLVLTADPFFTSCLMYRQMPLYLHETLSTADLVFIKGDVNYRRLLDDSHWPHTTPMEAVTDYFPASFVTLRTLKGEIMVGLSSEQVESLKLAEPDWLINGKRGVIQFVRKDRGEYSNE